ncbi:uncharacterized protein LOC134796569 [Cydia splendana]|uniref:uncharacterized protein LOC134796569 n=1 Tax=Cydia splendana TaxID=1100963 RepID=UPI0028F49D8E
MKLLNHEEVNAIIKQYGKFKVLHYTISKYSDSLIGYLGEHLKLTVTVEANGVHSDYKFFVKCMPKDQWLAEFLIESNFFRKEYVMLSDLFVKFDQNGGSKWRPKSLMIKKDIFIFEDVKELGYQMLRQEGVLNYEEMNAVVKTLARFHAHSFIYEEKKSQELHRSYRIWEDFSEHLKECEDLSWRNTGRNAVIEFLKVNSKRKTESNFSKNVRELIISLFDDALSLTRPSAKYRNTVIHRDLWCNNILIKSDNEKYHALIVDFQTVLYGAPTLDLSSFIYFNTTKEFRDKYLDDILNVYYEELSKEVEAVVDVDFSTILSKPKFMESYDESILFGMTQAAIIVPIIALPVKKREELFCDPVSIDRINNVSRSQEILDVAKEDSAYNSRITELFEDLIERYYYLINREDRKIGA